MSILTDPSSIPFHPSELDAYLMQGEVVVRGDGNTIWLEGAPGYSGPLPTDSPAGRLILCESPFWGDDEEAVRFILTRIQAALAACKGISTADLRRIAGNDR